MNWPRSTYNNSQVVLNANANFVTTEKKTTNVVSSPDVVFHASDIVKTDDMHFKIRSI